MAMSTGARRSGAKKVSKLVAMKDNGRGYPVGFIRVGGVLFQLDPSPSSTDGVLGWLKITKLGGAKRGTSRGRPASKGGSRWGKRPARKTTTRRRTSRRPRSGGGF